MIDVGIVGLGFMGMIHYLAYQRIPGVRVAAICEVNERRLTGDWTDVRGNFGPPGQMMDLSGVDTYTKLDDMLARPGLDLIDVTLPPSLHAAAAVAALQSGRHVFCEKPMSLRLDECERMSQAAAEADRRLFVGHVLPFFPEYAWALEAIRSERYGRLKAGSFRRVISNPAWLPNYWNAAAVGGPLFDLHIHDAHYIRLLFGMPSEVVTRGRMKQGLPEYWQSQFSFPDSDAFATAVSGTIDQQGRSFNHGFEIHLERATLQFEFAVFDGVGKYLCPPTLLTDDGKAEEIALGDGDPMVAFEQELRTVAECVRNNQESDVLGGGLAQDAVRICARQQESIQASRPAGGVA